MPEKDDPTALTASFHYFESNLLFQLGNSPSGALMPKSYLFSSQLDKQRESPSYPNRAVKNFTLFVVSSVFLSKDKISFLLSKDLISFQVDLRVMNKKHC